MFYVSRGNVPHKRHTQHRAPDGSLYAEELFGMEGFTGRSSLLYHLVPPDPHAQGRASARDPQRGDRRRRSSPSPGQDGGSTRRQATSSTAASPLFFNSDVLMGVVRPTEPLPDEHLLPQRRGGRDALRPRGIGHVREQLRAAALRPRRLHRDPDRHDLAAGPGRRRGPPHAVRRIAVRDTSRPSVTATTGASCWNTRRSRSATSGAPEEAPPHEETGEFVIWVRVRGRITAYHYKHHPFDVVGWDGYLWPYIFNIGDFEPITGRVHQPPPVHQTFAGRNYVVCSFVPRKFDYHPLSIPAPYNHSNINSDEVIYYVAGNFMSRRGVEISSFTVHPAGIPHGPHPGTVEASIGKERTEELAVMVDTFHPLNITREAARLEDESYPYSWLPPEDADEHARELSERGPEAFPD